MGGIALRSSSSNPILRLVLVIVAPLVISRIVALAVSLRPGRSLAERVVGQGVDAEEIKALARKYSRDASETVLENVVKWREEGAPFRGRQKRWAGLVADASELLLAGGTLLKVASEFLEERERLHRRR